MTSIHQDRRHILKTVAAASAVASFGGMGMGRGWAAPASAAGKEALGAIDRILQTAVQNKDVPGVVAMAATDSGVLYQGAFGKRDLVKGTDMTPDSVFWIASMTKALTCAGAMQLVEQGKLNLDEPISKVLPDLAKAQVLEGFDDKGQPKLRPAKRPITLRHLMTHTAGFTYDIWDANTARYQKLTGIPGIITCKNAALTTPLAFDPGERWEYGINIDFVGKAVEAVSGQNLDAYLREHLFKPLGMNDTGFLIGDRKSRLVSVHAHTPKGLVPIEFAIPQEPEFYMGGGGLYGTAGDYLAFLQMLMHGGTLNGTQVLKPETVAEMSKNNIGDINVNATVLKSTQPASSADFDAGKLFPGQDVKWGLSFMINTQKGPAGRSAGSLAWAGLANTYYWFDPAKKVAGVIMMQILPFGDEKAIGLFGQFESGVYKALTAS